MDCPRVEVQVGSFCSCLTDSPPWVADRLHGDLGPSAPVSRTVRQGCCSQLSPLLLISCFHFGVVWGLFLGLVGPL
jgi:hypothetical protein